MTIADEPSHLNVLLVEDNRTEAFVLRNVLSQTQWFAIALTHVSSLAEARDRLETQPFDLVLLDLGLPDSQGIETLTQLYNNNDSIPIIVLTADNDRDLAGQAIRSGAQDYLCKRQLNGDLLWRSIRYALERFARDRELRHRQDRYRAVLDNLKEAIFQTDGDGKLTFLNAAWTDITGRAIEESLGQRISTFFHHQDRDRYCHIFAEQKGDCACELRLLTVSGETRWLEIKEGAIFDDRGNFSGTLGTIEDITERKLALESERQSERRWRSYFEHSLVGIAIVSANQQWLEFNDAWCDLVGYSRPELLEKTWPDLTHPDDLTVDFDALYLIFSGKSDGYALDKRLLHKNGSIIYTRFAVRCVRQEDGSIDRLIVTILNLSDKYIYERQLQDSQEFLHHLIDAIPDPVFVKDRQRNWILANQACAVLLGKSPEDLVKHGQCHLFSAQEFAAFWYDRDRQDLEANEREMTLRDTKGRDRVFLVKTSFFDNKHRPLLVGAMRDISDRKLLEEKVRSSESEMRGMFAAMTDIVLAIDPEAKDIKVIPTQSTEGDANLLDRTLTCFWNDRDRHFLQPIETAIATGNPVNFEYQLPPLETETQPIWFSARISPLTENTAIWMARDISDRKAIERIKDEFLSSTSHELRTPLTSIQGALKLLALGRWEYDSAQGQRLLDIAVHNTDRLMRLVNDILDLERLRSGKIPIEIQTCNAAEVVDRAIESVQIIADDAEIHLHAEKQFLSLNADSDRIVQVLTNLLGNAIKFSPPQSTITVAVRREVANVLFSVRDRGRGIPRDRLETIFDRFAQVDASDARQKGGTGLGLAICREIVEAHNGQIWAESELGSGSTFYLSLPSSSSSRNSSGNSNVK